MLKDITIGQYLPGNSILHRLDARSKINGVFFFMIALFMMNNFTNFFILLVATIGVILISQVPLKYFYKGIRPLIFIIILTILLQACMTPGVVIWQWKFLHITKEGLTQALFMGSRLIMLVCITSVLTLTTTPIVLTNAIESMLNPFKKIGVPAHELAMMMTIALRFVPTLIDETDKIIKAQSARGADFESGNILQRAKALLPILVPLFISAFKRADELALAMEARGYHGGEGRSSYHELKMGKMDFCAIFCAVLLLVVVSIIRFMR